jgi:SAM-dependent methyltransferase
VTYAGAEFWDQFFRQRRESGNDLDWGGVWTEPFLLPLREAGVRTILELGCGTGNDAVRLAGEGGLFLFHVNALEDRPLRARGLPARELEPDYVAEASGQTLHFFSEAYLRELLVEWRQLRLESVQIHRRETGPLKHVWRGIARR